MVAISSSQKFLIHLVVVTLSLVVLRVSADCVATLMDQNTQKGYKYDLSQLHHDPEFSDDIAFRDTATGTTTYVNLCGPTTSCTSSQAICQRTGVATFFGFGSSTTQSFALLNGTEHAGKDGAGVTVSFVSGDSCGANNRWGLLHIFCSVAEPGFITKVTKVADCGVVIELSSKYGCGVEVPYTGPARKGGSAFDGGWIMIIIIFCCVVLYVGGFAAYNYKFKQARTVTEILPHWAFWSQLPGLVKDGAIFAKDKTMELVSKITHRGAYSQV